MQGFPRADYLCGYFASSIRAELARYTRQAAWGELREAQLSPSLADALRKADPFSRARCPLALSACGEAFDGLYSLATSKFYLYSNTLHRISTILQAA